MSYSIKQMAKALTFSHLTHVGARARVEDDDEEDDKKSRAQEDNDKKDDKEARAEEDDDRKDDDKKDDAARAEDDDDKPHDEDKGKRGKKAKSRAGNGDDENADDDDEEMHGKSAIAAARLRERERCAAIFACRAAGRNPELAANLAFSTRMTRTEAVAVLQGTPPPASPDNPERAARNPRVGPGGSPQLTSQQAIADSWDRAFARATNRTLKPRSA